MKRLLTIATASTFALLQIAAAGGLATGTTTGQVPLNELAGSMYLGERGGLYPAGSNEIPAAHLAAGQVLAQQVQPLDANGNPSASGKINVDGFRGGRSHGEGGRG